MRRYNVLAVLVVGMLVAACGGGSEGDNSNNGASNNAAGNNGTSNNAATNNGTGNNTTANNGTGNNGTANNNAGNNATDPDAGMPDDAGMDDAGTDDAGTGDTGTGDTGAGDTGAGDTGTTDPDTGIPLYTTDWNKSGTRLTAHVVTDASGNSAVAWFYDTQLELRCTAQLAGDGEIRCLPESAPLYDVSYHSAYLFGDANCTESVVTLPQGCTDGDFYRNLYDGAKLYKPATSYDRAYRRDGSGQCQQFQLPAGTPVTSVVEAAPADFVKFTREGVAVSDAVGVMLYKGEDGSSQVGGLWDVDTASPSQVSDGRAIPFAHYLDRFSLDTLVRDTCTGQEFNGFVGQDFGYTPGYVMLEVPVVDPNDPRGEPIGIEIKLAQIDRAQDTYCDNGNQVRTVEPGYKAYFITEVVKVPTDFPAVGYLPDSRDGYGFFHVQAADGTLIMPNYPQGVRSISWNGVGRSLVRFNGELVVAPLYGFGPSMYTNSTCTIPGVDPSMTIEDGAYYLEPADVRTGVCTSLAGSATEIAKIWERPAGNSGFGYVYSYNGQQCMGIGNQPAIALTDVTDQAPTLLPIVPTSTL